MNDAPPRWSRADLVLMALLAGLVLLFFWRIITPNPLDRAQFPPGDFTDQFYAFRLYEARALAAGRIPLWSENFNSGHPFLADIQSAVFYPVGLANTLLNLWAFHSFSLFALELEALLHFWLTGTFTYFLARRLFWRASGEERAAANGLPRMWRVRTAAFSSALVFTFGGYLTSYPSLQLAILETATWLPLALFFLDRAAEYAPADVSRANPGREHAGALALRDLLAAGLTLGAAALAGHPQTFLFVLAVSVVFFLWRTRRAGERSASYARRVLPSLALVGLVALGLAAIELVPAVEYQQLSTREALSFADAAKGFPTLDLLQFILPGYASAFASPLYVGVLPLWLALLAVTRRGRGRAFWGLVALGALVLAFGFYVFAYVVFYLFIPGASLFRQQERLAFVVSFALALLAGYGMLDMLGAGAGKRARRWFALLPAGAVVSAALLIVFFAAGAQSPAGRLAFLGDRAGLMLLLFGLVSLAVGLYLRGAIPLRAFVVAAVFLVLFDLWSVNEPANKGRVEDRFADLPFAAQLAADPGVFRVAASDQLLPGHFGIAANLQEIGGISPLRLARYDALLALPARVVYAALNVKYMISRDMPVEGAIVRARDGDLTLLELDAPAPRAWLVGATRFEPDDTKTAALLAGGYDVANGALLASVPPFAPDPRAATGPVSLLTHGPEHIVMDVNAPADALVVVSENEYPGWRATVDGAPTPILRADLTLRAIPVRAGTHRIEMWYEPLSFRVGTLVSALTLLGTLSALVVSRWRQGRSRE